MEGDAHLVASVKRALSSGRVDVRCDEVEEVEKGWRKSLDDQGKGRAGQGGVLLPVTHYGCFRAPPSRSGRKTPTLDPRFTDFAHNQLGHVWYRWRNTSYVCKYVIGIVIICNGDLLHSHQCILSSITDNAVSRHTNLAWP